MGTSLDLPFCISDIILFTSNPVQSSINMLRIFPDGKKSPKLFVTGVAFGRVQTWLVVLLHFAHSLLLGPQIEICNILRKTETTDKN